MQPDSLQIRIGKQAGASQQAATGHTTRQSSEVTGPPCFSACFSGWVKVGFAFAFSRGVETEEQILIRIVVSHSRYGLDISLPLDFDLENPAVFQGEELL